MEMSVENLMHDQASSMEGALIRKKLGGNRGNYDFIDSIEDQLSKSCLLNKKGRKVK